MLVGLAHLADKCGLDILARVQLLDSVKGL